MVLGSTQPLTDMSYHEYFLGGKGGRYVGQTALPLSCADSHAIWEPQPPGTLSTSTGIALHFIFMKEWWNNFCWGKTKNSEQKPIRVTISFQKSLTGVA
jgi:hypothetical protein